MNIMAGVRWRVDQVTAPTEQALPLAFVRDDHLKVVNGTVEDAYIEHLMFAAMRACERWSWRSLISQSLRLVCNAIPSDGRILLPRPPVTEVTEVEVEGVALDTSAYEVSLPTGPTAGYGILRFTHGVGAAARIPPPPPVIEPPIELPGVEPIRITYTAGFVTGPPPEGDIPADLKHAMLLLIGELYKRRTLSVEGTSTIPAVIQARDICLAYRPY
jgi:uncharacterized phiE125 gp8 family phage protein